HHPLLPPAGDPGGRPAPLRQPDPGAGSPLPAGGCGHR
ncbi:YqzL-like protein, partial [Dysosmobacter welbionis]